MNPEHGPLNYEHEEAIDIEAERRANAAWWIGIHTVAEVTRIDRPGMRLNYPDAIDTDLATSQPELTSTPRVALLAVN